jgi:hypothetical protein
MQLPLWVGALLIPQVEKVSTRWFYQTVKPSKPIALQYQVVGARTCTLLAINEAVQFGIKAKSVLSLAGIYPKACLSRVLPTVT